MNLSAWLINNNTISTNQSFTVKGFYFIHLCHEKQLASSRVVCFKTEATVGRHGQLTRSVNSNLRVSDSLLTQNLKLASLEAKQRARTCSVGTQFEAFMLFCALLKVSSNKKLTIAYEVSVSASTNN